MSTSIPPELSAHHCGRCGMWHQGSLCPDMHLQPPVTVIQGIDPQEHVNVTMERNTLREQNEKLRQALIDIAGWENWQSKTWREIAQEALGDA